MKIVKPFYVLGLFLMAPVVIYYFASIYFAGGFGPMLIFTGHPLYSFFFAYAPISYFTWYRLGIPLLKGKLRYSHIYVILLFCSLVLSGFIDLQVEGTSDIRSQNIDTPFDYFLPVRRIAAINTTPLLLTYFLRNKKLKKN